jgi:hypothetical protein
VFAQFLDGSLQLRDGRTDVGQLDDVGVGRGGQLAEFGEASTIGSSDLVASAGASSVCV